MHFKSHANIPVFVPHMGCPHLCVFCDQKSISGEKDELTPEKAKNQIEEALSTLQGRRVEIAFFGGSFTAIEREKMIAFLALASSYLKSGRVSGIRLSTRPDCVDEEILDILSFYGVSAVELGVQSLDEEVLKASGRGHSVKDTADACARIKKRGCFLLGCQMMLGLPASTREKELLTAREICRMGADSTRIYPTVVLKDTPLEALWKKGLYRPLSLEEGVLRGADCFEIFENAGVKVLRMGLCAEESCREQAVAGCYHPAYGELVYNRLYFQKLRRMLEENPPAKGSLCRILLPKGELSLAIGQKKCNKEELERIFSCRLKFEEWDALPKGQPKILRNEQ